MYNYFFLNDSSNTCFSNSHSPTRFTPPLMLSHIHCGHFSRLMNMTTSFTSPMFSPPTLSFHECFSVLCALTFSEGRHIDSRNSLICCLSLKDSSQISRERFTETCLLLHNCSSFLSDIALSASLEQIEFFLFFLL